MIKLMYRFAREGTEAALKKSVDVMDTPDPHIPVYVGAQD
jgi:hypothetical protein